jgi:hypothetical protein
MHCKRCGKKNEEAVSYCSQCGEKLTPYPTIKAAEENSAQWPPSTELPHPEGLDEGQEWIKTRNLNYVRPWIRYWARSTDMALCFLIAGNLSLIVWPEMLELNDAVVTMIVLAIWVVIEPWFLSTWGTTPGKALFRISIAKLDTDRKLNYSEAFHRAANVWYRGFGLGIPIVNLVTLIVAYKRLMKSGITSWDQQSNIVITHSEIGMGRTFLIILIWLGFFLFMGLLGTYLDAQEGTS